MEDLKKCRIIRENIPAIYDYRETVDIREFDYVAFDMEAESEGYYDFTVSLLPLKIGRPEFYPEHKARMRIKGSGRKRIILNFKQFDYKEMADAFMRYVAQIKILFTYRKEEKGEEENKTEPNSLKKEEKESIKISDLGFGRLGNFYARFSACSMAGEAGEVCSYELLVTNEGVREGLLNINLSRYGRESMGLSIGGAGEYYCTSVSPGETVHIPVEVFIHDNVPPGGVEAQRLFLIFDGDVSESKEMVLLTVRKRPHPYLFHTRDGWQELKEKINTLSWTKEIFLRDYLLPARSFEVSEPSEDPSFVFPAYSQLSLEKCAVAWKITGEEELGKKAALFLSRLCDKERGYLAKQQSYFIFIESLEEYERGDYKEHRASSGGWVQEAEFFIQAAAAYDLLFDSGYLTEEVKERLAEIFKSYMNFQSWLITDGDGNNFQLAEVTAGLFCAMALQEEEYIRRFLYGRGGFTDLLSSVLTDDGLYFEMASGYMKLAAELFLMLSVAAENYGIPIKNFAVQGCYDEKVILAPWASREVWAEDKKPFLGMSFSRFQKNTNPWRSIKQYLDALWECLTGEGELFSCNDGNEQNFSLIFDKAYYLWPEKKYLTAVNEEKRDLLYGKGELTDCRKAEKKPYHARGAGYAILRTGKGREQMQVVVKYGSHGGYHGHFDRMSLLSVIKGGKTFYNTEYSWFGYQSFLFKMWVQTSLAHNMVTVDLKMQEPSMCQCVLYEVNAKYQVICIQSRARWCDPPYGGQTPYLEKFPEEKCQKEGHYILSPKEARAQGSIGSYTEAVFQRRLVIVTEGAVILMDYMQGEEEHDFDLLYHPMGSCIMEGGEFINKSSRLTEDPYSAAQFVTNCHWYRGQDKVKLTFSYKGGELPVNGMPYIERTGLHLLMPGPLQFMVGRHPKSCDIFTEEEISAQGELLTDNGKKTVSLHKRGKDALFASVLEVDRERLKIKEVNMNNGEEIQIMYEDGGEESFRITEINKETSKPFIKHLKK